jgi:uncharacterized RDD family membrane protein YckC
MNETHADAFSEKLKRFMFPFKKREPTERDRYASYNERVLASTIDVACLFFLLYEPLSWLGRIIYGNQAPETLLEANAQVTWQQALAVYVHSELFVLMLINFVLQIIIIAVLLICCERGFGTTPGRYLVGIKLVDAKTEFPPSLWQLIRRFLGYFISLPPLMFGYLWCAWDEKRQTWHDKIAGTVMLDMRPRGWYWQQIKLLYRKIFSRQTTNT